MDSNKTDTINSDTTKETKLPQSNTLQRDVLKNDISRNDAPQNNAPQNNAPQNNAPSILNGTKEEQESLETEKEMEIEHVTNGRTATTPELPGEITKLDH